MAEVTGEAWRTPPNFDFFGVINVDVEAELAKLDGAGWRPLRPAQLRQLGLTP